MSMSIPLTKHNVLVFISCFIPVYLVVGGVVAFYYLKMDYSPLSLIVGIMFANLFTYLNLRSVLKKIELTPKKNQTIETNK